MSTIIAERAVAREAGRVRQTNEAAASHRTDVALAILRVVAGTIFVAHGAQKLFVFGLAGVTGAFEGMGVPMAALTGPAVSLLEFFGGIALIVGLFTRPVAIGLAATMLGAIVLVHLPSGFFAPDGVEFTLALFAMAVSLGITGAGVFSLDTVLGRRGREA